MKSIQYSVGRIRVTIANRDLLSAPVEVVVNPANSGLSHGGGLAERVLREAGPALDQACEQWIAKNKKLATGEAMWTTAGYLPYKAVIHCVSPRRGQAQEAPLLRQVMTRCLDLCKSMQWQNIAFPALGTGIFGIDKGDCARAFKQVLSEYQPGKITDVWICLSNPDMDIFCGILSPNAGAGADETCPEPASARVELDAHQISELENEDFSHWYKS